MKKLMIAAAACALTAGSFAETAGFQLSLTPDIAIEDRTTDINGVSIGVWNENPSEKFQWQFGFVNGATGDSTGVQTWLPIPLLTLFNYADSYTGVQLGVVNYVKQDFTGAQLGLVNYTEGAVIGLQAPAIFNYANTMNGIQFGLVNYAEMVENWAFQIGLANIINENGWFDDFPSDLAKGFVFVNWSFK